MTQENWPQYGSYTGFVRRGTTVGPVAVRGEEIFAAGALLKDLSIPPDGTGDLLGRWNGQHWVEWLFRLGQGTHGSGAGIRDICAVSNAVYVGGDFRFQPAFPRESLGDTTELTNLPYSVNIAKWEGTNWAVLSNGILGIGGNVETGASRAVVNVIAVDPGGAVYAGGRFAMQTSTGLATNIARWNGTQWEAMGSGIKGTEVNALAFDSSGTLYVGGFFTNAGGVTAAHIAKTRWDTNTQSWIWSSLGQGTSNGMSYTVNALEFYRGRLYAGGRFVTAGGKTANRVARWDGTNWWGLGAGTSNGVNGEVMSLGAAADGLYIGGTFTAVGGGVGTVPVGCIVKWGIDAPPTLDIPDPIVIQTAPITGQVVELTATAGQPCGGGLTVTWNVDGGPAEQTNVLAAGLTKPPALVPFAHHFAPGVHTVTVTVEDGLTPPVVGTTAVLVQAPAQADLEGSIADDGLPVGSSVTGCWSLVSGPAPVAFDEPCLPSSGAVFSQVGTYVLRLTGGDGEYGVWDEVTICVRALGVSNQPPAVSAGRDQSIALDETANLLGSVTDDGLPEGEVVAVQWSVVGGPGAVNFADVNSASTTADFDQPGDYVLRLTANDGEFSGSDDAVIHVSGDTNQPPVVSAGEDQIVVLPASAALHGVWSDDGRPYGTLTYAWTKADGPGTVLFHTLDDAWYADFGAPGTYILQLSVSDGRAISHDETTIKVLEDTPPPEVEILDPADGGTITAPTPIVGTASSPILSSYELQCRPVPVAGSTNAWRAVATGAVSVVSGELGRLDPTLSLNGLYELRLVAADRAGRTAATDPVTVVFDGNMKVGLFTMSFSDLKIPLSGIPIEIIRTYDSRASLAGLKGDFGEGWSLSLKDIRLSKNRPLGMRWFEEITGFIGSFGIPRYEISSRDRIVTITMPDNEVLRFKAVFAPSVQTGVPIVSGKVRFEPLPGTYGALEVVGDNNVRVIGDVPYYDAFGGQSRMSGYVDLIRFDEDADFNPQLFKLTTRDGDNFFIHERDGLQQIVDRNGNQVELTANGIFHSCGESIQFIRDAQGRIAQIVDPAGQPLTYAYDAQGLLRSLTDRTTNTTSFTYNGRKLLEKVLDARGVQAVRSEYDEQGRLIRQTDAQGKPIAFEHDIDARRETVSNRLGHVTVHTYDECGNIVRTVDALGGVTTYSYDEFDNKLSETNPIGQTTTWTYDARGNETSETDSQGNATRTTYDPYSQPLTMTDARGHATRFEYNAKGNLTVMTDAASNETRYVYDLRGEPIREIDALGHVVSNAYDSRGNLIRRCDAQGVLTAYTYDAKGNQTSITTTRTTPAGPETLTTSNYYDNDGRLTKVVYPDGSATETAYDGNGKEVARIDELGRRMETVYNNRGEVVRTLYPDGGIVGLGYDEEGRKIAETNRNGQVTLYEYDALGRQTLTIHPDGAVEEKVYDAAGRVVREVDARGNVTGYGYEEGCSCPERRSTVTNALGQVTQNIYDENGNLTHFIDANLHITELVYDAMNRRVTTIFPDGTTQHVGYDAMSRKIVETDQAGISTWYGYDAMGRLTSVSNAIGGVTRYEYDEMGNLTVQTDAAGHTTRFEYDCRGRRINRTLPEGQVETCAYDPAGNMLVRRSFSEGGTNTVPETHYQYDEMNRLTAKLPDISFNASNVVYTYDPAGQRLEMRDQTGVTTYRYDARGRLTEKAAPQGTLAYGYDAQGNVTNLQSAAFNGVWLTYTYDQLNRPETANDHRAGLTMYHYDAVGNLQDYIYPNGVNHVYQYDMLNRLTNLTVNSLTTPIAGYAYTLNPSGHRTSVHELSGRTVAYGYDNLYRLTQETIAGSIVSGQISYTYDAVGNRLSRNSTVANILEKLYSYDANDRLDSDTYDANGNTTAAILYDAQSGTEQSVTDAYDFENRLIERQSPSGTVRILYDGDGNRVEKTAGGVTISYLVDDRNLTGYIQVMEEIVDGEVNRVYSYGLDLISQDQIIGTNWSVSFYGYDGHGNVRFLTDPDGQITDT